MSELEITAAMGKEKSSTRVLYEELRLMLKDTPEALWRLKKLCRKRDTHYMLVNDHIGDVVITLGYLRAYKKEKAIKHLTLVIAEKFKEYAGYYSDDYDQLITISSNELVRICLSNLTRYGLYRVKKEFPNVTLINPADAALLGFDYFKNYQNITLLEMIRQGCLQLSVDADFRAFNSKYIDKNAENIGKKQAVISLDARTVTETSVELYEKLIPGLTDMGYEVFTNTYEDNKCLPGTRPLSVSLCELIQMMDGGLFIGKRSGLHDVLMCQDCDVIAIYPRNYKRRSLFTLSSMPGTKARFLEVEQSDDLLMDSKKIFDFIKKEGYQ